MTDRPDNHPVTDDLNDELTVAGDDQMLAEIRRQAALRSGAAPAGTAGPPEQAPRTEAPSAGPSDDAFDGDETIGDDGVLEALRMAAADQPDIEPARSPTDSVRPAPPEPNPPPAVPSPAATGSPSDHDLDDPTIGAPMGHPSRPEHPILGTPVTPPAPTAPPPVGFPAAGSQTSPRPATGGTPAQAQSAPPDRPAPPARPSLPDQLRPPRATDEADAPAAAWQPPARTRGTRPAAAEKTGNDRRSLPVWLVPSAAALVVLVILAMFFLR